MWDRKDYIAEAEKQLQDVDVYEDTYFKESDLVKLVEKSNTMFQSFRRKNLITEEELKYFSYQYKKSANCGKMYLLPKIHKRLDCISSSSYLELWNTNKKRCFFLDHHLQSFVKSGVSYIKD